ncbi:MAG: M28 family metallopeptidase [Candidatus Helarchaeota archaeon]
MAQNTLILNNMKLLIQEICDSIGPRAPCSKNETKCAELIKSKFEKYTSESYIENFYCHPDSYKVSIRVPMISLLVITVFYWLYYFSLNFIWLLLSGTIILISFIIIQTNLTYNKELIDPLFKKKMSTNVYAKFKPIENANPDKLIVIGGHHDSNYEFILMRLSPIIFGFVITSSIILNYLMLCIFVLKIILYLLSMPFIILPSVDLIILIILSVLFPIYLYSSIVIISNTAVLGADDNLTSIAIILEIARYLNEHKILKNTEIWLVSHGCEEIGIRGSKRFSKRHFSRLKDSYVINIDMVGGKKSKLKIDIMEEVYLIKLCKELGHEISKIANDLNIEHNLGSVEAFTDSMAYSQKGIKACSLIGIPNKGLPNHYHTRNDTIDNLNFNKLYDVYKLLIEFIKKIDKNELKI